MSVCVSMCVSAMLVPDACRGQSGTGSPDLESLAAVSARVALGMEPGSFAGAASLLQIFKQNHQKADLK